MKFEINDRVEVIGIGSGVIINIRFDDRAQALYTVALDDAKATPSGMFLARDVELRRIS